MKDGEVTDSFHTFHDVYILSEKDPVKNVFETEESDYLDG